jgi:hypothetical protein
MDLETIGNIILALSILAGGITFLYVNLHYKPDDED